MARPKQKPSVAKKKTSTLRAEGKTQISISLPDSLVKQVDQLAAAENRNRSNFIATAMARIAGVKEE